jgi:hypothetical protein
VQDARIPDSTWTCVDPGSNFPNSKNWIARRILRLALQAIGFADVRSGFQPLQSGFRRNDE